MPRHDECDDGDDKSTPETEMKDTMNMSGMEGSWHVRLSDSNQAVGGDNSVSDPGPPRRGHAAAISMIDVSPNRTSEGEAPSVHIGPEVAIVFHEHVSPAERSGRWVEWKMVVARADGFRPARALQRRGRSTADSRKSFPPHGNSSGSLGLRRVLSFRRPSQFHSDR